MNTKYNQFDLSDNHYENLGIKGNKFSDIPSLVTYFNSPSFLFGLFKVYKNAIVISIPIETLINKFQLTFCLSI